MTKTVVFSDMHGREFVVKDLFRKIGLMDAEGNRAPGFKTIQIGDLLSLGYGEQEAQFLSWIREGNFIDISLCGNHEYPSIGPYPDQMTFVGYEDRDIVAEQMIRSEFNKARMEDDPNMWVAATYVGDWLITHAGASIQVQKELGIGKTAKEYAEQLNEMWIDHIVNKTPDPIFINPADHTGGIFWHRLQYLRAGYRAQHVPQIVGHSGWDHNKKFSPPAYQNADKNLIAIDTPGSCCALITEDDGENWDIVTSDYEVHYGQGRRGQAPTEWQDAIREITPLDELPTLDKRQGWLPN